jgi:predicted transcriptional regulator
MTTLRIGIADYEEMKTRTLAIAAGQRKRKRGEPKVWFTSMESVSRVLSHRNRALLELIARAEPG